jgi:lipopolysaccharide transport system ATP-binding protein
MIKHEGKENYTALRDVLSRNAKKIFSFSGWKAGKVSQEEFWALKDIDFDIEAGDRVGIIGRNGAGKSTLLKILSRITEPTKGSIKIKGRIASLLEVGTGFHPELSGRENIFLNGAILGMSRNEIKRHFDAIVEFAEVEKFLDTPVKRYSSGMYVRLAFAVAAHLEPEILIVDEVLAVGDAQFQKKCLGKMEDVSKNDGRTILFVSHNMGVVSQLCTSAILLNKGTIDFNGPVSAVVDRYLSNQSFTNEFQQDKVALNIKPNHIDYIRIKNEEGQYVSSFSFDQRIVVEFKCRIQNYSPDLLIGIGMQDKSNSRVFTVVKEAEFFKSSESNVITGTLKLPGSLFAPNVYSFVFALWTKMGQIHDVAENVCVISIHDNGTSLAAFEGADYGSVIINPIWESC